MTQAIAQLIRQVAREGVGNASFRNEYSGRGMLGQQCVAVTGSSQDCRELMAEVIKQAHAQVDDDQLVFDEVVDALMDYRQDSMGLDVVIYWPHIQPVEIPQASEEPQEWERCDLDPNC